MLAFNIVVIALIVTAIVMIPLRIRAHRRALKEIDELRSFINEDVKELIEKLEPRTVHEKKERPDWLKTSLTRDDFRQVYQFFLKLRPSGKDIVRCALPLHIGRETYDFWTEKPIVEFYQELQKRPESIICTFEAEEEQEDPWIVATAQPRSVFLISTHRGKLVATP